MSNIEQAKPNPVAKIKGYLGTDSVKSRFEEMLGKQAGAFANSIINVVRADRALSKCSPDSVLSAAMMAATLNLPIYPALGQSAIVPYGTTAQFQIMYKGVVQLCIRSGLYATIHCTEVYRDEIESWNPITGEIRFTPQDTWKMRPEAKPEDVAGHFARFKLLAGFEKCDYMTAEDVLAHAKKYSKAYQYDLRNKKQSSLWSTDPVKMGNKTALLRLLTKYGVMSIELQQAMVSDSVDFAGAQEAATGRIESEAGSDFVDVKPLDADARQLQEQHAHVPPDDDCPPFMRD